MTRGAALAVIGLAAAGLAAAQAERPAPIEGKWLTDDGNAIVVIGHCGGELCGAIHKVLDRGRNVPTVDIQNPDQRLRSRPLIGLTVLSGFRPDGAGWRGGRAYDPKTGKSYRSSLALDGAQHLIVTGCVLFFCRSMIWQRLS